MSINNDNEDLEALFDSVAASVNSSGSNAEVKETKTSNITNVASGSKDSEDLESLFERVAAETHKSSNDTNTVVANIEGDIKKEVTIEDKQERVFNKVGQMVRSLNNTLGDLSVDKLIEKAVYAIPDAKDRLDYVANLTEQAACRVLNATDMAIPLLEQLSKDSKNLDARWDKAFNSDLTTAEFKQLAEDTRSFFKNDMKNKILVAREQLTEIMMAQDFQDLTGQVIKKVVVLAQELETGLMEVLLDVVPDDKVNSEVNKVSGLMNGPVVNPEGRADVVVNQQQVDDLLDSLGF